MRFDISDIHRGNGFIAIGWIDGNDTMVVDFRPGAVAMDVTVTAPVLSAPLRIWLTRPWRQILPLMAVTLTESSSLILLPNGGISWRRLNRIAFVHLSG